jgi:DNA repair exonuclease SbcCD nuclease subunit
LLNLIDGDRTLSNLFKKVACFTDIHFGLKSNSHTNNQDCEDFVDWYIAKAKEEGCDTGIFLGDWHHNRNSLNITTMDYSLRALEKLGQSFDQFYFFPGNHDLYYKDKRDIHSVEFGKYIPGITVVHHPITEGNVTLCPWLVGEEWKQIGKKKAKYIFGHFELPHFYMNAMVQMPDHGEIQLDAFDGYDLGFSGHFHKRQSKKNMHYIGNAFPHNYADAWDDDRGMMVLEWGGKPKYISWDDAPKFRTLKLSTLIDDADKLLKSKMHLRVSLDIDISYEEASFIKEKFVADYDIRELTLIPEKKEVEINTDIDIQAFESVDQIVSNQLVSIESDTYDSKILLSIYNSL